jgi:hypothetical protein
MRWPWSSRPAPENPAPPKGIILCYRGRVIPCTPLRDEDADEPGCAAWLAVPDEPVALQPGEEFVLTLRENAALPDDCVVLPGFAIPGLDEEARPGAC